MAISSRETGKPLAMEMVPVGNHHAEKQGIQPEMRGREAPLPVKRHDVWVPLPVKRYHGFGVCQARHQHRGRHRHKHLWNGREWVVLAISRLSDHKEQRQRQEDIEMLFHGKRPEVPRRSLPVALDKKEVVHNVPPDLVLDGKWMLQEMGGNRHNDACAKRRKRIPPVLRYSEKSSPEMRKPLTTKNRSTPLQPARMNAAFQLGFWTKML